MLKSDLISYSFKNIKNNKKRFIVTSISIFLLSLLLTIIISSSINLKNTLVGSYNNFLVENKENVIFECDIQSEYRIGNGELLELKEIVNDSNIELEIYSDMYGVSLYDLSSKRYKDYNYTKYKNWVYLNTSYEDEYALGDSYYINDIELIVKDYIEDEDVVLDIEYYQVVIEELKTISIHYYHNESDNAQNCIRSLNSIKSKINKVSDNYNFDSYILAEINKAKNISNILILISVFASICLILVSLSTIINCISISSENNQYLNGLKVLLGMKKNDLIFSVFFELFVMTLVSVFLSFIVYLIMNNFISNYIELFYNVIVDIALDLKPIGITVSKKIYVYIPFAIFFSMYLITFIFLYRKMKKQLNITPIEIINEVHGNEK